MSELSKQRQQLKIQQGIRQAEDFLVTWIQDALDNKKSYGKLEEAQFRNLVRVANTTESTKAIENFLRYQVGRDKKWGRGKDSLAEKIIQDIDGNIQDRAREIANTSKTEDIKSIWIELTRRYLGYGARYLTYKLKGESQN
ncbi:MAG: hypothetical protein SW833_06380 [Cyanobacteriota bacterium]|nr:hypothetical protein [Cyanobacteriota bacterium]